MIKGTSMYILRYLLTSLLISYQSIIFASDLNIVEITERNYQNAPAIAVIFDQALDPSSDYNDSLSIKQNQHDLKDAWVLSKNGHILYYPYVEPDTEYTIIAYPYLRSKNGEELGEYIEETLTTRKITPSASFATQGVLLPANISKGLPIVSINVPEVSIDFFHVPAKQYQEIINGIGYDSISSYYTLERLQKFSQLVFSGRFELNSPKNTRITTHIPVEQYHQLQQSGLYFAVMRLPGHYSYDYETTHFFVSDIGLHLRAYPQKMLVFASSLKTGQALENSTIRLYNAHHDIIWQGATDHQGKATIPHPIEQAQLITADYQNQLSFLSLTTPALDLSDFDLAKTSYHPLELFIYSPRDLYRPGEQITFSALLRNQDGQALPVSLPLHASLYRPDGQLVKQWIWQAQDKDLAYYQNQFTLSPQAQTGHWNLYLWADDDKHQQKYQFQVEEFLPERLKLATTSSQTYLEPNSNFIVETQADYLYGSPAANNRIKQSLIIKNTQHLPQWKDFYFGDTQANIYQEKDLVDSNLDAQGHLQTTVAKTYWGYYPTLVNLKLSTDVFESGGRSISRSINRYYWPAEHMIGIRPLFDPQDSGTGRLQFEMIATNPDGELITAPDLELSLIKEDRDYYWEYSDSSGWKLKHSETHYPVLTDQLDTSNKQPTSYALDLEEGIYRLEILNPSTQLITSLRINTGWHWWSDKTKQRVTRPDQVRLQLNQTSYQAGDTIELMVTPPHDGEAIILVEADQPLWLTRIPVSSQGSVVKIPVSNDWQRHDIYITATLLRPASAKQQITPNRAMGVLHLPLARQQRQLQVQLMADKKIRPQTTLNTTIKVAQAPNETVKVTLAAVDVGILNLTNFKTPDPFAWFFQPRRYQVDSYDLYDKVIEFQQGKIAKLKFGGDADDSFSTGGKQGQAKVKITSLFSGLVELDANGEAVIPLEIPDFNGQLRLMAVAFSEQRYGQAEQNVTVASPIIAEISMPRFLAATDQSQLVLDVQNLSGKEQNIALQLNASSPIRLTKNQYQISLKDQQKTIINIPMTADQAFGVGDINLELSTDDGGIKLQRHWQLAVRPAYPAVSERIRQILSTSQGFSLQPAWINNLIPSTLQANLKVSSQPPMDTASYVKGLLQYPYGCLEQTTSRAYPLLYARHPSLAKFGLSALSIEERNKRLDATIQRLLSLQQYSGGFTLWDGSNYEEPWLTPYVTNFLLDASEQGVDIPKQMLDKVLNRLQRWLNNGGAFNSNRYSDYPRHLNFASQSYTAYILARVKQAPLGSLRNLFDQHKAQARSGLPLLHLSLALYQMGDMQRAQQGFKLALKQARNTTEYLGDYGSPVRDTALMIYLLHKHNIQTEQLSKLVFALSDQLKERTWLSTQEKFALLMASLALQKNQSNWQAYWVDQGQTQLINTNQDWQANLSTESFKQQAVLISQNKQPLYLSLLINAYPDKAPKADMPIIGIERHYYNLQGQALEQLHLSSGDLVLVHIQLSSNQKLPDALLVDLLPAGLELENQNFRHNASLNDIQLEGKPLSHWLEYQQLRHQEYREDRYIAALELSDYQKTHLFYLARAVVPGVYTIPPTYVEDMYRPEIRSIGITPKPLVVLDRK